MGARTGETNALLEAVERTASERPGAVAYEAGGKTTTYGELWAQACSVAAGLASRVPGRGPVVVLGGKEALTVASFLGCLMSGHAYVPVDAELPAARVRDIAGQIPRATVLAACDVPAELSALLPQQALVDARELASAAASAPDRSAWVCGEETQYVIFTSGSTGRPKGIEVTADNVANFMGWITTFPVVKDGGRTFLDQAHYSFDLSEFELVGALATGGLLHALTQADAASEAALFADLASSGVEVWVSTPSFADLCLADPAFAEKLLPDLRLFLFCGEALRHTTAEALTERFPDALVANTYGPTESTVAVTYTEVTPAMLADPAVLPVGYARPGTELAIVDHQSGEELPAGTTGEIVICGDTVARGYFANPLKTAEAFFVSRLSDGRAMRAYRTGDLGHLDADGMLHCEGRIDSLIKLNGYRIELDEVEGALEAADGVAQAAVVPRRRGGRIENLVAFVVADRAAVTGSARASDFEVARALKAVLARTLPSYMVPRQVRVVDSLPLTANEKVDRKGLAASVAAPARAARRSAVAAPAGA